MVVSSAEVAGWVRNAKTLCARVSGRVL
jgi:hypothetical protein